MKIIFDIGGTSMRISSVENGKVGEVLKISTPQDLESAKKVIVESINKVAKGEKVESIVGGVAGILGVGTIMNAPNISDWDSFDLGIFLRENFCKKIGIYNDAHMAGLGESLFGAGRGISVVAYICVGTGVGGARIVNGEIDTNKHGFEPGRHILDVSSAKGNKTFQGIVSGEAIKRKYGESPKKLGQKFIKKLTPVLATGLYNAILFWSPDVLVVGGGLMNEESGYKIEEVKSLIKELKTKGYTLPEIKKSELGDLSGLWGALAMTERRG